MNMAKAYRGMTAAQYLRAAKAYRNIDRPAALLAAAEAERLAGIDRADMLMGAIHYPGADDGSGLAFDRNQTVCDQRRRLTKAEWVEFLRGELYGCDRMTFAPGHPALDDTLARYADIVEANTLAVGEAFFSHLPRGPDFHADATKLRREADWYLELAEEAEVGGR